MTITIFILGLLIGSFLNVCVYRIPREESIVYPPSHCTSCGEKIKPWDLVPVLSWLILKGKCRSCGSKVSGRYAMIEVFTGLMYLGVYLKYGLTIITLKYIIMISFLIVIALIDYDTTDVYSCTTYPAIAVGIVFIVIAYFNGQEYLSYLIGGVVAYGVIALIALITGAMGWGDAEITAIIGVFMGWKIALLMLLVSFIIGAINGVFLICTGRKTKRDYIPFGPSIVASGIICVFVGEEILRWYLSLIMI